MLILWLDMELSGYSETWPWARPQGLKSKKWRSLEKSATESSADILRLKYVIGRSPSFAGAKIVISTGTIFKVINVFK